MPNLNQAVFVLKVNQTVMFPPCNLVSDETSDRQLPSFQWYQGGTPAAICSFDIEKPFGMRHHVTQWDKNVPV